MTTAYKVITIPTSYFIDTKGVIQDKFIGPMTQKEMEKRVAKLNNGEKVEMESSHFCLFFSSSNHFMI